MLIALIISATVELIAVLYVLKCIESQRWGVRKSLLAAVGIAAGTTILFLMLSAISLSDSSLADYPSLSCAGIQCRDYYGAQIVSVAPGSMAEKGGLLPGDIILRANGKDITSCADLEDVFREAGNGRVEIETMMRKVTPTPSGSSG